MFKPGLSQTASTNNYSVLPNKIRGGTSQQLPAVKSSTSSSLKPVAPLISSTHLMPRGDWWRGAMTGGALACKGARDARRAAPAMSGTTFRDRRSTVQSLRPLGHSQPSGWPRPATQMEPHALAQGQIRPATAGLDPGGAQPEYGPMCARQSQISSFRLDDDDVQVPVQLLRTMATTIRQYDMGNTAQIRQPASCVAASLASSTRTNRMRAEEGQLDEGVGYPPSLAASLRRRTHVDPPPPRPALTGRCTANAASDPPIGGGTGGAAANGTLNDSRA